MSIKLVLVLALFTIFSLPVLSNPTLQLSESESLSLSSWQLQCFLPWFTFLSAEHTAFLVSVWISWAKFIPSFPLEGLLGLGTPPAFLWLLYSACTPWCGAQCACPLVSYRENICPAFLSLFGAPWITRQLPSYWIPLYWVIFNFHIIYCHLFYFGGYLLGCTAKFNISNISTLCVEFIWHKIICSPWGKINLVDIT